MQMLPPDAVAELRGLVRDNLAASRALKHAATNVEDAAACERLYRHAEHAERHAVQLQSLLMRKKEKPAFGLGFVGRLWAQWVDLKSAIFSREVPNVLRMGRTSLLELLESYHRALGRRDLGIMTRATLRAHEERIFRDQSSLLKMKRRKEDMLH